MTGKLFWAVFVPIYLAVAGFSVWWIYDDRQFKQDVRAAVKGCTK